MDDWKRCKAGTAFFVATALSPRIIVTTSFLCSGFRWGVDKIVGPFETSFRNTEAVFARPMVLLSGANTHHMLSIDWTLVHLPFAIFCSYKVLLEICGPQQRHFLD